MLRSTSSNASSSSPKTQEERGTRLTFSGIANLFIRLRRHQDLAAANAAAQPGSPSKQKQKIALVCQSGDPQSHPGARDGCKDQEQVPVELTERFVCRGGVNTGTLVRATRMSLLDKVENLGANALLDEKYVARCVSAWSEAHCRYYQVGMCCLQSQASFIAKCSVQSRSRRFQSLSLFVDSNDLQVSYSAKATRSSVRDVRRPVALDKAQNVPGLMTIVKRQHR